MEDVGVLIRAQDEVLRVVAEFAEKYGSLRFTGGTALARVYLNHRVSEDLDFSFESEKPVRFAQQFSTTLLRAGRCQVLANDLEGQEFTFKVSVPGLRSVKVELFQRPHRLITDNESSVWQDVPVESLSEICLGKMEALVGRRDPKDVVDLLAVFQVHPQTFRTVLKQCGQMSLSTNVNDILGELKKRPVRPDPLIRLLDGWTWERLAESRRNLLETFRVPVRTGPTSPRRTVAPSDLSL